MPWAARAARAAAAQPRRRFSQATAISPASSSTTLPGSAPEKFYFTVLDNEAAQRISKAMGKRVSLHYEEKVGLPGSCFGDTRYYVTGVSVSEEIPLAAGVMVPSRAASAASAGSAP